TETGFGAVSYIGVENVNLTTAGGPLTVTGTVGDDRLEVTPTGAGTGAFQAFSTGAFVSTSPRFSYAGLGAAAFTVNGAAGFDVLAILGSDSFDAITATAASTVTVTRTTGSTVTAGTGLERLDVFAFQGNDYINLTAFTALNTFIDAGEGNDRI